MIGSTCLLDSAAMPFPTLYPTIIVMIGKPWSCSIAPTAMSTVMQIKATRAIRAFDGLKVMPISISIRRQINPSVSPAFSWLS